MSDVTTVPGGSTRMARTRGTRGQQEKGYTRAPMAHTNLSMLEVPLAVQQKYPHKVFGFIRFSWKTHEDRQNFEKAVHLGWDPTPAEVCPEFARRVVASPFERGEYKGSEELIRRSGHVLMWCDREDYERRISELDEETLMREQAGGSNSDLGLLEKAAVRTYGNMT